MKHSGVHIEHFSASSMESEYVDRDFGAERLRQWRQERRRIERGTLKTPLGLMRYYAGLWGSGRLVIYVPAEPVVAPDMTDAELLAALA